MNLGNQLIIIYINSLLYYYNDCKYRMDKNDKNVEVPMPIGYNLYII